MVWFACLFGGLLKKLRMDLHENVISHISRPWQQVMNCGRAPDLDQNTGIYRKDFDITRSLSHIFKNT